MFYPVKMREGLVVEKGFVMLANAMEIDRWDPGVLRRLKKHFVVAGCDFYRMGIEEGVRNYAGIADVVFTSDPQLIEARDELPFAVMPDYWFPAKAIHSNFLDEPVPPSDGREYDIGIFKRAGWEKNWDFLLDGPDPFVGKKVYVHCPWHETWYNEREKAIFHKVVRVCRKRGYFVDTRVIGYMNMYALYDKCRSAWLFSTTESDSRMMTEAFFRGCFLFLWANTKHLIPAHIIDRCDRFNRFEDIQLDDLSPVEVGWPRTLDGVVEWGPKGSWGVETSAHLLQKYYESCHSPSGLVWQDFYHLDAHDCFYHVCREGEEKKMLGDMMMGFYYHED